jgi:hypothetical protein
VTSAQTNLTKAQDSLKAAGQKFCGEAATYISAVDRYGRVFTDSKATVGDVKTADMDLAAPQESVTTAAAAVTAAHDDVTAAQKELADAQAALDDDRHQYHGPRHDRGFRDNDHEPEDLWDSG